MMLVKVMLAMMMVLLMMRMRNEDGVEVERERTMVGQRRIWGGEMDAISQSPGEAPINKN